MKGKEFFAWSILVFFCLLPGLLLWFFRPGKMGLSEYAEATHVIGQLLALVGTTMFALNFVLSTRAKPIEDSFGGLDKVYKVHAFLGAGALSLLAFHPIFLVLKYLPMNAALAANYLLPSSNFWSINFGIVALLGLLALIFITIYAKLRYNIWKISHKAMGIIFIFAVLHIFLIRTAGARDSIFAGYYIYAGIVSAIGLGAFAYTTFFNVTGARQAPYKVESVQKLGESVYDIRLAPLSAAPINYKAGQFIFASFRSKSVSGEAHPFSIASKSRGRKIRIVVKNLGDYTKTLESLKAGDLAGVEGRYGRFNNSSKRDQIWVAGGIGITPFLGMSEDLSAGDTFAVDLYYSVKSPEEFVSLENLKSVEKSRKNFRLIPWVTGKEGFLTADKIIEISGKPSGKEIYLCGPAQFKEAVASGLISKGAKKSLIHSEEFNFK